MDYKIIKFDKIQIVPEWRNRYGSQIKEYVKNGKKFCYLFARHGTFLIDDEAARRCDICGKLTNLIYMGNCRRICSDKCALKMKEEL